MSSDLDFLYQAGFNQEKAAEADGGFEPIPAGWYQVRVKAGEICTTKAGTGKYVKLRLDVEGPSHAGRVIFTNINVVNPNETAQEIGQAQFARLLISAGLDSPKNLSLLVGKVVEAKITIRPARDGYDASNDVQSYRQASSGPVSINGAIAVNAPDDSDVPF